MGCGWDSSLPVDWNMISAIEAVNGGAEQGPYSGISFWEKQLQDGHRITAIGASVSSLLLLHFVAPLEHPRVIFLHAEDDDNRDPINRPT